MRGKRYHYWVIVLSVLSLAAALRHFDPPPLQKARLIAFDTYQRLEPRKFDPSTPVRIIDIDDASLAARGQWPWPRSLLAELVDKLEQQGAVAIVFDMVFSEPDRLSPGELARLLPKDDPAAVELAARGSNDETFATSIARSGVVMGFVASQVAKAATAPPTVAEIETAGDDPRLFVPYFKGAVVNLPVLTQKLNGSGFLNWIPDHDQIVRRLPLILNVGGKLYPSIAAEALRLAQGVSNDLVVSSGAEAEQSFGAHTGIARFLIGNLTVPTDASGGLWLRFSLSDRRRYLPAASVLEGSVDGKEIKGHIVLVGTSAAGLLDVRATPLEPAIPGVEIHAQAIEQMLAGPYLYRPDFAAGIEVLFTLVMGLILAWSLRRSGAAFSFVLGWASTLTAFATSWMAFHNGGVLLDPVFPTLTLASVYLVGTSYLFLMAEADRNRVRHAFGHYMAPAQVEKLASDPSRLKLGGENRELTLLFADVRGFTTISEGMDAEELTRFVNQLFTPLSNTIIDHGGTIDKFMGDAVMAFWNAPLDDPLHAANACRAALKMLTDVDRLNTGWSALAKAAGRTEKPVRIGIGLNTSVCCVGNFGSEQRFDYSVIGDGVNLASRLEGLTKSYGVSIIAGEATIAGAPEFAAIELDLVKVKGKSRSARIFAILGGPELAGSPAFIELKELQTEMLKSYRSRDLAAAKHILERLKLRRVEGLDLSIAWGLYEKRLRLFDSVPPPGDWDGSADATEN